MPRTDMKVRNSAGLSDSITVGYTLVPTGIAATDTTNIQGVITEIQAAGTMPGVGVPCATVTCLPGTFVLNDTIEIDQIGIRFVGFGVGNPSTYAVSPGFGTTFKWAGAAGEPMVRIVDYQSVSFSDIYFQGDDTAPPSAAIYSESVPGADKGTAQYLVAERCRFGYLAWHGSGYQMDYCIRFAGLDANNDQFCFRDCQFEGASTALVRVDNPQSIWGLIENCYFDGRTAAVGVSTLASLMLVNPQFNRCTVDVDVYSTAKVDVFGWNSENATISGWVHDNGGKLIAKGGKILLHAGSGSFYMRHDNCGGGGMLDLDAVFVETGYASPRPKIRVRGNSSTDAGTVRVRGCNISTPDFDFQAGSGTGGLVVSIDDIDKYGREKLLASAVYTP